MNGNMEDAGDWDDGPFGPDADDGKPQGGSAARDAGRAPQGGFGYKKGAASAPPTSNVDNVGIRAARPTPFGGPLRPLGSGRPPGTKGGPTPPPASNVDNVGTAAGFGGRAARTSNVDNVGSQAGLSDALRELGRLESLGILEPDPDASAPQHASPVLTRLAEPVAQNRTAARSGPSGPDPAALAEIRAAAKAGLEARANRDGTVPGAGSQPSRRAGPDRTVAQATLDAYLRRGALLFDRYRRELDIRVSAEETNPVEFTNWLLSLKPTLKSSSWRTYRQAALHWLEGFPGYEADRALELIEADVIDRSRPEAAPKPKASEDEDEEGGGKGARKTSAQKEKRFPIDDYERVLTYLRAFSRSKLSPTLVDWLEAGITTGLRPSEWRATDLEVRPDATAAHGRRAYLYVINAKGTNGRGTGVVRTLDLSAFSDRDLEVVQRMVGRARAWLSENRFADMQAQCSALLYGATGRIWPTRRYAYALYSTRHQAISNWKAIITPEEIAAIVGHGITATASTHYGKRRSSWPVERIPVPPRPVPEELSVVRQRMRLWEHRNELERKAGLRRQGDDPEFPVG